jgi:hypothetical protein
MIDWRALLLAASFLAIRHAEANAVEPQALRGDVPRAHSPLETDFRWPSDPRVPMVELHLWNGRLPQEPSRPELVLYPDGRVVVTASCGNPRTLSDQLPNAELHSLLHTLVTECQLLQCRSELLDRDVRVLRAARQRPTPGPDAGMTLIRLRGDGMTHEIRCAAVGLTATQLPDLKPLQQVYDGQRRLENVASIVRAGGYRHVQGLVDSVNAYLRESRPGTLPLTCRELCLCDTQPDGTRYLQFSRMPGPPESLPGQGLQPDEEFLMVSVYAPPHRPLEILVSGDEWR